MRAEVLGLGGIFEVELESRPDGTLAPPAVVTLTLRPCWRKPAQTFHVAYLYTNEAATVAYYDVAEEP